MQLGLFGQLGVPTGRWAEHLWSHWVLRLLHLEGEIESKFDSGFKSFYSVIFEVQVNSIIEAKSRMKRE